MKYILTLWMALFLNQVNGQITDLDTVKENIDYRFKVRNLNINNEFSSFGTTFYGTDKIVYSAQNEKRNKLDLFIGTISTDGELINIKKIESLSSKSYESNVTFTKDGKTVYFTRSRYGKTNTVKTSRNKRASIAIFKANVSANNVWTNIEPMPFNSRRYDVGHPSLSTDGKKLYFTSNMPGGFGDADIYYVDVLSEGNYSAPINMGKTVNSEFKEVFPSVTDNILYYSSDRTDEALGGLDIFAVKILGNGKVSRRVHLDPPVNSIADDISYIYDSNSQRGYFSSNRKRGQGEDDIYGFSETRPLTFDCLQTISGEVLDSSSNLPLPRVEVTLLDIFGKEIGKIKTKVDGKFTFANVSCSANYKIIASKRHLGTKEKNIVTKKRHNSLNFYTLKLDDNFIVMRRGKKMLNISNIFFDYDSAIINQKASEQLNKVIAIMQKYPNMCIELGAHTDSRGGDAYNLDLSKRRAQSTIDYIRNNGKFSSDRIKGDGYGETRLLNHCDNKTRCSKSEHLLNRRTEFVITKM